MKRNYNIFRVRDTHENGRLPADIGRRVSERLVRRHAWRRRSTMVLDVATSYRNPFYPDFQGKEPDLVEGRLHAASTVPATSVVPHGNLP